MPSSVGPCERAGQPVNLGLKGRLVERGANRGANRETFALARQTMGEPIVL